MKSCLYRLGYAVEFILVYLVLGLIHLCCRVGIFSLQSTPTILTHYARKPKHRQELATDISELVKLINRCGFTSQEFTQVMSAFAQGGIVEVNRPQHRRHPIDVRRVPAPSVLSKTERVLIVNGKHYNLDLNHQPDYLQKVKAILDREVKKI